MAQVIVFLSPMWDLGLHSWLSTLSTTEVCLKCEQVDRSFIHLSFSLSLRLKEKKKEETDVLLKIFVHRPVIS